MADALDAAERGQLLLDHRFLAVAATQRAVDQLDGLEQSARGLGFPDFAETALAQRLHELVAGDRFDRLGEFDNHTRFRVDGLRLPATGGSAAVRLNLRLAMSGCKIQQNADDRLAQGFIQLLVQSAAFATRNLDAPAAAMVRPN